MPVLGHHRTKKSANLDTEFESNTTWKHGPDLRKETRLSEEQVWNKQEPRGSRKLTATFPRDPALELGPMLLKDQHILHGGNEDRSRDPSHRVSHLRSWKTVTMTRKEKERMECYCRDARLVQPDCV